MLSVPLTIQSVAMVCTVHQGAVSEEGGILELERGDFSLEVIRSQFSKCLFFLEIIKYCTANNNTSYAAYN